MIETEFQLPGEAHGTYRGTFVSQSRPFDGLEGVSFPAPRQHPLAFQESAIQRNSRTNPVSSEVAFVV